MSTRTQDALIRKGFSTDLIEKILELNHTVTSLRSQSRAQRKQHFTVSEITEIKEKIVRSSIDKGHVEKVIELSGGACCYCQDGNTARPFQIHHIVPYSETQDHSVENLMLCCPTHHAVIHSESFTVEQQLESRGEWYSIQRIAKDYAVQGINFPYGSFESVYYDTEPDPGSILSPSPPKPSTAIAATNWPIREQICGSLDGTNFALVSGISGSGKTSLALGAAGTVANRVNACVYAYRVGTEDARSNLREILQFISVATNSVVLIIDDANAWATVGDIESIQAASTSVSKIIVAWSQGFDSATEGRLFAHLQGSCFTLQWTEIRESVLDYIEQEQEILVPKLAELETSPQPFQVGLGHMSYGIRYVATPYANDANTLWQFTFLLYGGAADAFRSLLVLKNEHRSDVVLMYSAIEQIAGFEQPVSIDSAATAARNVLGDQTITENWVVEVFERWHHRRRINKVRDKYRPIHRRWSIEFIEAGLCTNETQLATTALLDNIFWGRSGDPTRLAFLWSWMNGNKYGMTYIDQFATGLTNIEWFELFKFLAKSHLAFYIIVDFLHLHHSLGRPWSTNVLDGIRGNLADIEAQMPETPWRARRVLLNAFQGLDIGKRILHAIPPEKAAQDIAQCEVYEHDHILWAFASAEKIDDAWLKEVGKHLSVDEFIGDRLSNAPAGNLDIIFDTCSILHRLSVPLRYEDLQRIVEIAAVSLENAQLHKFRANIVHLPYVIYLFPDLIKLIIEKFPVERLANEMTHSVPADWQRLGTFFHWLHSADRNATDLLTQTFWDEVDSSLLTERVRKFAPNYIFEFRCLLIVMNRASIPTKQVFATELVDVARDILRGKVTEDESRRIVSIFGELDSSCGHDLSQATGIWPESKAERGDVWESLEEMQKQVAAKIASDSNFDVWEAYDSNT